MTRPTLLLASRSPRRAMLLQEAGVLGFRVLDPPFDDPAQPPADMPAKALVAAMAEQKAESCLATTPLPEPWLMLAADTVCVDRNGRLIGKPADAAEARAMLHGFRNQSHRVVTAVAWRDWTDHVETILDATEVVWGNLTERAIEDYLASQQWVGKAGGYNLADRQGAGWLIETDGDPTTVMGLPMRKLIPRLQHAGVEFASASAGVG